MTTASPRAELAFLNPCDEHPTVAREAAMVAAASGRGPIMRITGAHSIIYTTNADADRAFLRDVLKLPNVDAGHGWLIFGLPPAKTAKTRTNKRTRSR